jgi:hypothetical protein
MPGTATNYDVTRLQQGPGDLWIIGGGVADSATPQLTITGGTPDATAYPASIHLGSWPEGQAATITTKPKMADIKMDQFDTPVAQYMTENDCSIEVELAQLDPAIIANAAPYGVYSTGSGYRQLTFGGMASGLLTPICVALIAQKRAAASKYVVAILFNAVGTMGLSTTIGRAKASVYKASFKGLADPTRAAGRQIGVFYETI